jgi:hypothetical protein
MLKNRTVWLFGVAGIMALSSAGCIIGDTDDSAFVVDWDLMYVPPASNPNEVVSPSCADAHTPNVDLDVTNRKSGATHHETFKCTDGGGRSQELPVGTYDVTVSLKNDSGRSVSATAGQFDILRRGLTDLGSLAFGIQSFRMNWTLARGNAGVTCESVNAKTVTLTAMLGSEPMMAIDFPCNSYAGQTPAIPTGTYSVRVQLFNASGGLLSEVGAMTVPVNGSVRADLPAITFGVN